MDDVISAVALKMLMYAVNYLISNLSEKGFTVVVYFNRTKQGDIEIEISKGSKGIGFYKIESLDDIQKVYKEIANEKEKK